MVSGSDPADSPRVWGIHNDTLDEELIEGKFVSIGWDHLTDLRTYSEGRESLKRALLDHDPDANPRAVPGWAGILYRFSRELRPGDVVVAPYKPDSTINIGVVTGDYYYESAAQTHPHRIPVEWKKLGLSRTVFTQAALYEIGSALTLFRVRRHASEFLAALQASSESSEELASAVDRVVELQDDEDAIEEPRASRIERHTRDFILEALHTKLTHEEFEYFTAALIRAVGYQARVTAYSQDGGIDVIAHKDPLGIEPPQIKIQCKHRTGSTGAPEVQQLIGAQGDGDLCLFVTLGSYTRDALTLERQRTGLRLLGGEDVVTLVLDNYDQLPQRWKSIIPLTSVLVVADSAE